MIIWLASYPKSGNTWVRSFLSAYYYSSDGKFTFELLKKIKQFPSKEFFDRKLLSVDEASQNWLIAQKKIKDRKKICFLKTHNVNGAFKGNSFTTTEFTAGAIYIVRDPRNVLTSVMNHYSLSESDGLKMMNSVYRNLRDVNDNDNYSNYSFISSWSNNYNSWKLSKNINSLFIKYEDLENDKYNTFSKIVNFTNNIIKKERNIDENKFKLAIETTNFEVLQKKEEYEGFDEAVYSSKEGKMKPFFNLGRKNNYKNLLKPETSKVIEGLFEKEMKELGYL
mgnify:FL=1